MWIYLILVFSSSDQSAASFYLHHNIVRCYKHFDSLDHASGITCSFWCSQPCGNVIVGTVQYCMYRTVLTVSRLNVFRTAPDRSARVIIIPHLRVLTQLRYIVPLVNELKPQVQCVSTCFLRAITMTTAIAASAFLMSYELIFSSAWRLRNWEICTALCKT